MVFKAESSFCCLCLLLYSLSSHQTMRFLQLFTLLSVLVLVFKYAGNNVSLTPSPSFLQLSSRASYSLHEVNDIPNAKKNIYLDRTFFQLLVFILLLIPLQYETWLLMCYNTSFVPFDTNLNLFKKNKYISIFSLCPCLFYSSASFLTLVFLGECEPNCILLFVTIMRPNVFLYSRFTFHLLSKFRKTISMTFFVATMILISSNATTPNAQYVCICAFQIFSLSFAKKMPPWLSTLLIFK